MNHHGNGTTSNSSNSFSPHIPPLHNDTYKFASAAPQPAAAPASAQTKAPPQTDIISAVVSDFGIWQLRSVLILFLCKLPASWFMACIIFTAPFLQPGTEYTCAASDLTANQTISADQCDVLDESVAPVEREPCTHFLYDYDFKSVIMEFDLVCAREIFVAWTQYWHLFGVLLGGVIGTKMMLFLSPRKVYLTGQLVQVVFGVITGYTRDLTLHCAFRCLSAICCAMMFTSAQAIFADITGGVYRTGVIILYDTFWSIGVILLPGLSSFFKSWTHIYLAITFPTLLLTVLLIWTPESPRWLLKNGSERNVDRVECLIREAAAINDRTFKIPPDFRQQLETLRDTLRAQPAPASWLQLWKGPRAKTHMIAAHLALAAFVVNYMGMLLNIRSFGRDYLVPNTIAMGFSEIIGCFLALHFMLKVNKWKYQWAGGVSVVAGLVACLGWIFTNANLEPGLKVALWMIIATVAKMSVSCSQSMLLACVGEVMPLNKRQPFVFSAVTWARIWLLSAPFINVLKSIDVAMSLSAFGVITVFGGICTALILTPRPPTRRMVHQALPQHAKEQSPLNSAIWTVDNDVNNTHL